ncbi:MAG: rhomboid family intramembrane serine protease [Verrucomicrobiota bacterium]
MSIYSRDYMKEGGGQNPRRPSTWSVVTWLMVINAVIFLSSLFSTTWTTQFLWLSWESLRSGWVWTLATYQFTHQGLLHFAGNMIGLFFLGRLLLQLTRPKVVLQVYLVGGLVGGIVELLFDALLGIPAVILGASASVYAIIAAVATLVPHQSFQLLLFFVLPVKMTMRQLVLLLVVIDSILLVMTITGQGSGIAVMAHFGGLFFGWLYMRFIYNRWADSSPKPEKKKKKGFFGIRILPDEKSPSKPRTFVDSDVDAILDKINEHGFQSLSDEEKETLEKSSKRLSKRLDHDS